MRSYRERLRAPISWWVTGMITMFTFGSIVWFGFPLWTALVTYGALFGLTAAFLLNWGRVSIEITDGELRAAGQILPVGDIGEVRPLDDKQTEALRGPRADPRAYQLTRPYLWRAVYVEVCDPEVEAPYWLLGSRHPERLAAAIDSARPAEWLGNAPVG
jgi:Protein of unknown function (DUF3093)